MANCSSFIFYDVILKVFLIIFCVNPVISNTVRKIGSYDFQWTVKSEFLNISIPCTVPGSVYFALLQNHVIGDPYFKRRDSEYAWIADEDWTYTVAFKVPKEQIGTQSRLCFYGLNGVSEIYLNGKILGNSDNMFITYSFNIKNELLETNTLEIRFLSPTKYVDKQSEYYKNTFGYVVPPKELPEVQHGRNHQNFIRKDQCSFSWDWGPSFPAVGIWKDVQLELTQIAFVDNLIVHVTFDKETNVWMLRFEIIIESSENKEVLFKYGFDNISYSTAHLIPTGKNKIVIGQILVDQLSVSLWWPRGYGNQTLYEAWVHLFDPSHPLDSISKRVKFGFRTVELVEDSIPLSEGLSFYFKINSRPIFLKGSNWIPADSFQERVTTTVLEELFQSAIDANINTLRVWGGGIYEQDEFYTLADKYGILIWQDLMFAVALYPTNKEFLKSVEHEITNQVHRLQNHPCLIAWSGNNENEAAIAQNWWEEVKQYKDRLIKDYVTLYVETIKPIIMNEDPTRPFVTSSPSNGPESIQSGYIAKDPQSPLYGDVHFYDYKNDCWNVSIFPNPRFVSEYGYQSYPSFVTMSEVATTNDLKWNSSLMYYRQHHSNGNQEIEDMISLHYKLPSTKNEQDYFRHMIYLSQIVQATCIKYESEHYRRLQGNLINGTGHTMGALYWQLNDIWQAPSWSSIEYGGRWKMLHYYVKDFFSSLAVTGHVLTGYLYVHYVTDHPEIRRSLTLSIASFSWLDFQMIWTTELEVDIGGKASDVLYKNRMVDMCTSPDCFIKIFLKDKTKIISETDVFSSSFSSFTLSDPNLKVGSVTRHGKENYEITLNADRPAAFIWFETTLPGRFSKNGFNIVAKTTKVMFYCWRPCSLQLLTSTLQVISLYDLNKQD